MTWLSRKESSLPLRKCNHLFISCENMQFIRK
jgi:hypothetical protein